MDFFEAMQHIKNGNKVRIKTWNKDSYIGIKEEEIKVFGKRKIQYTVINSDFTDISPILPFSALVSADWTLIDED